MVAVTVFAYDESWTAQKKIRVAGAADAAQRQLGVAAGQTSRRTKNTILIRSSRQARSGMCIDEFNGDNFDHGPLGFFGGGYLGQVHGRPMEDGRGAARHAHLGKQAATII
jgi:hypothetical protein